MVAPSARRSRWINSASLLLSRSGRRGASAGVILTDVILRLRKKLRLRRLAGLDRVLRSLVDGDRFQPGRRQFKCIAPPGFVTTPERRSRFCVDLAGKAKLHELGARLTDSRALHRLGRCQAAVLTLGRALIITSCASVSLTLMIRPFLSSRRPGRSEPRTRTSPGSAEAARVVGSPAHHARRVSRPLQCSSPNGKPVLSAHGAQLW